MKSKKKLEKKYFLEEHDVLAIFRQKNKNGENYLKTKLGTFIFDKEKLEQLKKLYKKSKYYKNGR